MLMAKNRAKSETGTSSVAYISRTRRAQLVAEFEGDLGIDYKMRAKAVHDAKRWHIIKTFIVWTIALMFFSIACQKLWLMGQDVDRPFSDINPVEQWF